MRIQPDHDPASTATCAMPSPPIRFGHEPDARLHAMRLVATILFLFFYIPTWGYLSELVTGGGGVWVMIGLLSFVAILVHELGHAVAARWAGARVINIVAIPFELRLRPLRLSWASTAPGRDIGGYVTYTFDDESRRGGRPSSSPPPGRPRILRWRLSPYCSLIGASPLAGPTCRSSLCSRDRPRSIPWAHPAACSRRRQRWPSPSRTISSADSCWEWGPWRRRWLSCRLASGFPISCPTKTATEPP